MIKLDRNSSQWKEDVGHFHVLHMNKPKNSPVQYAPSNCSSNAAVQTTYIFSSMYVVHAWCDMVIIFIYYFLYTQSSIHKEASCIPTHTEKSVHLLAYFSGTALLVILNYSYIYEN